MKLPLVIAAVLFTTSALAQAPTQVPQTAEQQCLDMAQGDLGLLHRQMIQIALKLQNTQAALQAAQARIQQLEKEHPDAKQNSQAAPHDGSGSPQPEIRPQDGNPH